jgi:hypothetical protein
MKAKRKHPFNKPPMKMVRGIELRTRKQRRKVGQLKTTNGHDQLSAGVDSVGRSVRKHDRASRWTRENFKAPWKREEEKH